MNYGKDWWTLAKTDELWRRLTNSGEDWWNWRRLTNWRASKKLMRKLRLTGDKKCDKNPDRNSHQIDGWLWRNWWLVDRMVTTSDYNTRIQQDYKNDRCLQKFHSYRGYDLKADCFLSRAVVTTAALQREFRSIKKRAIWSWNNNTKVWGSDSRKSTVQLELKC